MSAAYHILVSTLDKFVPGKVQPLWNHAAGPKTIFFWAPVAKWVLVLAGVSDLCRPVEKVSVQQSIALTCTGLIWSRYSMAIKPRNFSLFSVNCFIGLTGLYQAARVARHHYGLKTDEPGTKTNG